MPGTLGPDPRTKHFRNRQYSSIQNSGLSISDRFAMQAGYRATKRLTECGKWAAPHHDDQLCSVVLDFNGCKEEILAVGRATLFSIRSWKSSRWALLQSPTAGSNRRKGSRVFSWYSFGCRDTDRHDHHRRKRQGLCSPSLELPARATSSS
jgi:hypothetical protein